MIIIGKPSIEHGKSGWDRIEFQISFHGENKILWYEYSDNYSQYVVDHCDAAVVSLLLWAMRKKENIKCLGAVSERLYFQLMNFMIPSLSRNIKEYSAIEIDCKLDSTIYDSAFAVGTGLSGGVDSFYTIAKFINCEEKNHQITHLTFFNVGASGDYGGEDARKLFIGRSDNEEKFARDNALDFLRVDSNVSEILQMPYVETHSFRSMAVPLLFQGLFRVYYYSSAFEFSRFSFNKGDTANWDLLNVHCLSTETLNFYSVGGECRRIDKEKYISGYMPARKYLNVCVVEDKNCSRCDKCKQTLLGLYAIGKLPLFKEVFDLPYFYKHISQYLGYMLARKDHIMFREIYDEIKSQKKKIPFTAYLYCFLWAKAYRRFREKMRVIINNNPRWRKLYKKYIRRYIK